MYRKPKRVFFQIVFFLMLGAILIMIFDHHEVKEEKKIVDNNTSEELLGNQLLDSNSAYLLQNAHSLVNWHPYSAEVIDRAKKENKLIFINVGYSSCDLCSVMDREVFSNEKIAALMNEIFINVKIDRDERPDLDQMLMAVTNIVVGEENWPNNVVLTPDFKPFIAGANLSGEKFLNLLNGIKEIWPQNKEEVDEKAEEITVVVGNLLNGDRENLFPDKLPDDLYNYLAKNYDDKFGGFGLKEKHLNETSLLFLLKYYQVTGQKEALDIVQNTIDNIIRGGIHDHLEGGFYQYAMDRKWHIPYFEKNLYNQALILEILSQLYDITKRQDYLDVAKEIVSFVGEIFTSPTGSFFSNINAKDEFELGGYYLLQEKEIEQVLTEKEKSLFDKYYYLDKGVLILRNIVWEEEQEEVTKIKQKLLSFRIKREIPFKDSRVIVAWNSLMIKSLARFYQLQKDDKILSLANKAMNSIIRYNLLDVDFPTDFKEGKNTLSVDTYISYRENNDIELKRINYEGGAYQGAFLDDYSNLISALLELYKASDNHNYLTISKDLIEYVESNFMDKDKATFFFSRNNDVPVFSVNNIDDRLIPNSNAVMAHNYITLYEVTIDQEYLKKSQNLISKLGKVNRLERSSTFARAVLRYDIISENHDKIFSKKHIINDPKFDLNSIVKLDDRLEILLEFKIDEGRYTYSKDNQIKEDIIAFIVDIKNQGKKIDYEVIYPEPKKLEYKAQQRNVYRDDFIVKIAIDNLKKEEIHNINILGELQLCKLGLCIEPVKIFGSYNGENFVFEISKY